MREIFSILFGATFTVAVATALGSLVLGRLRVTLYRMEAALIAFVAGAGCLSFLIAILCVLHQARKGVFLWGGAAIIALAVWQGRRTPRRRELPAVPLAWSVGFVLTFAIFGIYYLTNALAPEVSPDGSGYHLGNVARLWRNHGFVWDYHSMYSYLSQGTEMLFLMAYSFGRHPAAAVVHFGFLCSVPLLIVCWGRRFGYWKAAFFAASVVWVSPVFAKDGTSAYNDLAVVTVVYAVFYLLQVWDQSKQHNLLILIGLLCGAAYAAKYTTFLTFPFALAWVLVGQSSDLPGQKFGTLRQLLLLSAPAALLAAPWVIRNWVWLGNPAAPFLNWWFPNPYYHPGMERIYAESLKHYYFLKHFWQVPLELTLRGGLVEGMFGPVFLLFPFALFALRLRFGRQLLLAALVFAVPAYFNVGARFLMPSAPFLALAMGVGLTETPGALPLLAIFQVFLCWPPALSAYCTPWTWRISSAPVAVVVGKESPGSYLRKWLPDYALKGIIEESVPKGERVFSFAGRPEAYIDRDFVVSYESALGNLVHDILWAPQAHPPQHQQHFKFLPVTTRGIRVVNMGSSDSSWTVSELRIRSQGRELSRTPNWRLSAKPNGWEVQLAFDNSYATRWSTWQGMSPGDWIQVDLPAPEAVDEVVLECDPVREAQLQVEILLGSGRWVPITDTIEDVKVDPPAGMRRAAARDVKALGFHYILLNEGDLVYEDIIKYPAFWGVTEIAKNNGTHFYRID
jgi:hypothetical protein